MVGKPALRKMDNSRWELYNGLMVRESLPWKRGSLALILIGLISVMVLFAFAISRRLSGHSQLLTIGDHTQIARYFLESYVNDVVRKINLKTKEAYNPSPSTTAGKVDPIVETFLKAGSTPMDPAKGIAVPINYEAKGLLSQLAEDLRIDLKDPKARPVVKLVGISPLGYPDIIDVPASLKNLEKRGFLSVTCSITFNKRPYTMSVQYPFSVVMRLTPILREFVLFCDQIHLEQQHFCGAQDKLNIVFTKESIHPKDVPGNVTEFKGNQPWILMPSINEEPSNKDRQGRVFLGSEEKPIYLNVAGEKSYREGKMSEVWQIWPEWFKVNTTNEPLQNVPLFEVVGKDGQKKPISFRGMKIPLSSFGHEAAMGVLGFCNELVDPDEGFFAGSAYKLADMLGGDPNYKELINGGEKFLTLASSLKLFGPNGEGIDPDYAGPLREVFGKVFGRFVILTFFKHPSGFEFLKYGDESNWPESKTWLDIDSRRFKPDDPNKKYTDFMSRIVSGGADFVPPGPDHYFCLNPESKQSHSPYSFKNFSPKDGMKLNKSFDYFGEKWFQIDPKKRIDDTGLKSVQARITRFYPNQESFLKASGHGNGRFWVDGVVYVKGNLRISEDITTKDVRGGIVLVENEISLPNITRGFDFKKKDEALIDEITKAIQSVKQEQFLTFVSLNGAAIKLTGDRQVGVQVISLRPKLGSAFDQISWTGDQRIIFCGGIAVSTPRMENRAREFGRGAGDSFFFYVPSMAEAPPSTVIGISPYMQGYKLFSEEASQP